MASLMRMQLQEKEIKIVKTGGGTELVGETGLKMLVMNQTGVGDC